MHRRSLLLALVVSPLLVTTGLQADNGHGFLRDTLYTMSNATSGNRILSFARLPDGRLLPAGSTATGGTGSGGGLGNQGGLTLSSNERWLLAVNAGSHSVSIFAVRPSGLSLRDVQPSGGLQPVSVTVHGRRVYVLNAQSDSITGFRITIHGALEPIAGSTRTLSSTGTAPAQVSFSPDGRTLVVTEKATNNVVTFPVDRHGVPGDARVQPSNGATPFGFAFAKQDHLLVSEAFGGAPDASAVSSYDLDDEGGLTTVAASVGTTETAACWVAVTPNGRYAYVTNTASGTVSGYAIDADGSLALLDADGRTGVTGDGTGPIDLVLTDGGRFLYTLNGGSSTITGFRVHADGGLTLLPGTTLVPAGANGLASR